MTKVEIEKEDGALLFKGDGSIEILIPNVEDEDAIVSQEIQFMTALGILLNEGNDGLVNYVWEKWNKMVEEKI